MKTVVRAIKQYDINCEHMLLRLYYSDGETALFKLEAGVADQLAGMVPADHDEWLKAFKAQHA